MKRKHQYTSSILFFAFVTMLGGVFFSFAQAETPWYDTGFQHRVKITIDHTKVANDLTNFPVYVDLGDLPSTFFSNVQNDGGDIRVTKADGTTEVPLEVVSIDTVAKTGEMHFKYTGTLSSTQDNKFYVYYGNTSASGYADTATYGTHNVWTNGYAAVYHMEQGDVVDSTANGNDGANNGTTQAAGKTGQARSFNGSNNYIDMGDPASLDFNNQSFSLFLWMKTTQSSTFRLLDKRGQGAAGSFPGYQLSGAEDWTNTLVDGAGQVAGFQDFNDSGTPNDGNWHQMSLVWDNSTGKLELFTDGGTTDSDTNASLIGADLRNSRTLRLGAANTDAQYFNGEMDEVRIASVARTAGWIGTEYANQNSPSIFYTVSAEEEKPNGGSATIDGAMSSTNYMIQRSSINAGGADFSSSPNYQISDTIGQLAPGRASSTSYRLNAGYRHLGSHTISISDEPNITMPNLSGISAGASVETATWTVTTDNLGGYKLTIEASTDPAMQSSGVNFSDYAPSAGSGTPTFSFDIPSNESAFGFSPEGVDITSAYQDNGSACGVGNQHTTGTCWSGFTTTPETIASSPSRTSPSGTPTTIRFRAEIGADKIQPSGTYQATITVTALAI